MARLLFFGKLGDLMGARTLDFDLPADVKTVSDLIEHLAQRDELLGATLREKSVRFAVNERVVARDANISDGDEIAFLPPASGG